MKKYIPTILTGAACVLLAATVVQNMQLKSEIEQLNNNLSNRIANVESSVNRITYNIQNTLEEGAALLLSDEWYFEEADIEAGTVTAVLEVTPKEYHPEKTKATIICGNREYPMTLQNGVYQVKVDVSLFQETYVSSVAFEEDGVIRRESLNWGLTPRYEFLPVVYGRFSGGWTGSPRDGVYTIQYDGKLDIDIDHTIGEDAIRSITVVEMVNEEVTQQTEIPMEEFWADNDGNDLAYIRDESGQTIALEPVGSEVYSGERVTSSYDFDMNQKKVSFPYGSTYAMYVEVEDGNGLLHRVWVRREKIDETGKPAEDDHWWWDGSEASIFSADGEPLAVHDEQFY